MAKTEPNAEIIKICPNESDLAYVGPTTCPTCNTVFSNSASCELHQIKKHKKESPFLEKKPKATYQFFCPKRECKYSLMGLSRYFTKMKYLKQHYMKSHAKKTFVCKDCEKPFPTQALLTTHKEKECGIEFSCIQCDASYRTREALLTHCSRTRHINSILQTKRKGKIEFVSSSRGQCRKILPKPRTWAPQLMENIAAAALSELSRKPVVRCGVDASSQTCPEIKRRPNVEMQDAATSSSSTQTEKDRMFPEPDSDSLNMVLRQYFTSATQTNQDMMFDLGMFQDIDQHVNNETQTEYTPSSLMLEEAAHNLSDTHTQTAALDEYSHNYTQTCDDIFLNDFIDIETQTAWASLNVDSFLVSAQTQTLL